MEHRLSNSLILNLGGEVAPYDRNFEKKGKKLSFGEDDDFSSNLVNYKTNDFWVKYLNYFVDERFIIDNTFIIDRKKSFLWVIDATGLKIILESTPNPRSDRGCVCHTNITNGGKAIQGGEIFFCF